MLATRVFAAVLALVATLPLWRLLPQRPTGLAGAATAEMAAAYSDMLWSGLLVALIPALIAAMLFDAARLEAGLRKLVMPLTRPRALFYALTLALLAALLAALVAALIAGPTLIDSFAQLTHARYLADGRLSGPLMAGQEFWHIQQTIVTDNGWVSQYPPGYAVLLAIGFKLGAVALIGPLFLGIAIFFTTLVAEEIVANQVLARFAALLAALSPFMLGQAGAYMSHVPAAAFSTAALYFVMRAERDGNRFAVAAGVCIGALFTIRPLTGIVAAIVAIVYAVVRKQPLSRIAFALAGALPFLAAIALYNNHFFGAPTTFGYQAALGSNAGLGFGIDPWGNQYGITEALAYTSAELTALSIHLLETPIPIVLLIGIHFALSHPSHPSHFLLLFWWPAALVFASLLYWHHGLHMGPRMLADMGPLWVVLAVVAVAGLIARIRIDWEIAGKYSVRAFATGGVCAAVVGGLLLLAPQRMFSYVPGSDLQPLLYAPNVDRPALVFVHGGWTARIAMRLAAHGMRMDSVETALRQNSTCAAHKYALAYARGEQPPVALDFTPRAINLPRQVETAPGNRIRVREGEQMDAACAQEIAADTAGVIDVTPFLWQGDLPGLTERGPLFVRDMGAQLNAELIRRHPNREPLMLGLAANGQHELRSMAR